MQLLLLRCVRTILLLSEEAFYFGFSFTGKRGRRLHSAGHGSAGSHVAVCAGVDRVDGTGAVRGGPPLTRSTRVYPPLHAAAGGRHLHLMARRLLPPVRSSGSPSLPPQHRLRENGRVGIPVLVAESLGQENARRLANLPNIHKPGRRWGFAVCRVLYRRLPERRRQPGRLDIVSRPTPRLLGR